MKLQQTFFLSSFFLLQSLRAIILHSFSMNLATLDTSLRRNHTVSIFLCPASFTEHKAFYACVQVSLLFKTEKYSLVYIYHILLIHSSDRWLSGKKSTCQCSRCGFDLGLERSPGEGNDSPLQFSCLARESPWTEPGGLKSMGSQKSDIVT